MESNRERLSQEIDRCLAGELNQRESIMICNHTPIILQKLGLSDYPILFSQGHLRNCLHEKGQRSQWHGLNKNDLIILPQQLCEPAIVYDSLSSEDSIVIATGTVDCDNLPIIASIRIDGEGWYRFEKINSNYLTSIYGHEHFENIISRSLREDGILYVDKEKTQRLGNLSQLQLLRGLPQLGYDGIIHKSENIVNSEIKPILDNAKIQEFNQKWKKRGFLIKYDTYWKQYQLLVKGWKEVYMKADYSPEYTKAILSLKDDGSLDYADFENQYDSIKWILPEEKEFYKNNPDIGDNWNDQHIMFNVVKRDLLNDIECLFEPREDQVEEFYKTRNFIQQKMKNEFLTVAGCKELLCIDKNSQKKDNVPKPKSPIDRAKSVSQQTTNKNKAISKDER